MEFDSYKCNSQVVLVHFYQVTNGDNSHPSQSHKMVHYYDLDKFHHQVDLGYKSCLTLYIGYRDM
eukprot:01611.XXX_6_200_1 [CDS] Oithona nana genome sequencing.